MTDIECSAVDANWETLRSFLPQGWQEKAKELNALSRIRGFSSPDVLLRVMLLHLVGGHSLRVTAALAREGGLAKVSDVALFKRIKLSGDWFLWMASEIRQKWLADLGKQFDSDLCLRAIDATIVNEPGVTGSTWRIHYSLQLDSLSCDEVHVTTEKTGESFCNFSVNKGDVLIGDRGYHSANGIFHVYDAGGYAIVRLRSFVNYFDLSNNQFNLLEYIRDMTEGEVREYPVLIKSNQRSLPGRLCVVKKSAESACKAKKAVKRRASRRSQVLRPETIEYAGYVVVLCTLPASYSAKHIMELYRQRWQIELAFKRLKSLLELGHLRRQEMTSAKAWLQGKLFVAMLLESLLRAGEGFFPWGYPIIMDTTKESMARNGFS